MLCDPDRYGKITPIGAPSLFCRDDVATWWSVRDKARWAKHPVVWRWGTFSREAEALPPVRWEEHAGLAALVLAVNMQGVRRIDCYGVDMSGTADFTGEDGPGRTERRWHEEREAWKVITSWAGVRGVTVERHT